MKRTIAAIAGSIIIASAAFPAVGSSPTAETPANQAPQQRGEAEHIPDDAAAVARDLGLPVALVKEQVGYQELMDTLDLEKLDPNFAAFSSQLGKEFAITYATHGKPPSSVIDALATAGLLRFTEIKDVPYSGDELAQAHTRINSALRESEILADTSRDPLLGEVEVTTAQPVDAKSRQLTEQAAGGVPISWEVGELATPAVAGGYAMTTCTAGFVVKNQSGTNRGLATAGHCDNPQSYGLAGGGLNFLGESYGGTDDFQWHDKAGVTWDNQVNDGVGTRAVTGRKSKTGMNVGDQVSKYGKTTHDTTGTIVELYFCPSYVPNCLNSFVLVNNNAAGPMCDHGDSGGPVFWNNNAWGFVSGLQNNDLMIFAPQQYTQGALNVIVWTG